MASHLHLYVTAARNVYVIRTEDDPDRYLRQVARIPVFVGRDRLEQPVIERTYRTITTEADLVEALALHGTPDDAPGNTESAYEALCRELGTGRLRQFIFSVPDYEGEKCQGPRIVRDPLPDGTLVIGAWSLADLLSISRRQTFHAFDHGLLDVIESTWKGVPYRYAVVNERMAEWASRYERWVRAVRIDSTWFTREEMEQEAGMLGRRDEQGRFYVYVGYSFIVWAARRRGKEQLQRIIQAQVTQ